MLDTPDGVLPSDCQPVPDSHPAPACDHMSRGHISGTVAYPVRRVAAPAMRMLIAEDDAISRTVLERTLRGWGYDVVVAKDGDEAWSALLADDAPQLAILDWMMPGLEGPEVCRRVRALARPIPTYLLLLTAKTQSEDIVTGLDSGADDYVTKPFDRAELRSRLRVGERVLSLQRGLAERVFELETALGQVKELKGLLPICSYCKAVRDDRNYWHQVETYVTAHTAARFSHGICPGCWKSVVEPQMAAHVDLEDDAA